MVAVVMEKLLRVEDGAGEDGKEGEMSEFFLELKGQKNESE